MLSRDNHCTWLVSVKIQLGLRLFIRSFFLASELVNHSPSLVLWLAQAIVPAPLIVAEPILRLHECLRECILAINQNVPLWAYAPIHEGVHSALV